MEVLDRVFEHKNSATQTFPNDYFVIALQGSHNYGLEDENSDVDTKMLTLPRVKELVLNSKSLNKVHIMENEEHCDCKDVRDYFKIMRKMNINFTEILYTDYWIANPKYQDLWLQMRAMREELTRANEYRFMKCCKGMVYEKAHALAHPYPSKLDVLEKHGYDGKQLSHMIRVFDFAYNYSKGATYEECLRPSDNLKEHLIAIKRNEAGIDVDTAFKMRDEICLHMTDLEVGFNKYREDVYDKNASEFLDDILFELITRNIKEELI